MTPLLARVQVALFGASPAAIRIVPALVSAASVVLGAVIARNLGGRRRGQILAAGVIAGAGFVLATGHLLSTATFDFTFWLAGLVVAMRMLRTDDPRNWLGYGVVAGLALWNKHLIVLLTLAILASLTIERRWKLVATPWLVIGGLVTMLIAAPTVIWQAANGWPQVEMAQAIAQRIGGENRILLLPLQLVMLGPLLVPLGWAGVTWLTRPHQRNLRPLLWAYVAALVLTLVTGGRPYYPLPLAAVLVIAGVVATEDRWPRLAPTLVISALIAIPLALPVLPVTVAARSPLAAANETLVEQLGWIELTETVADVVEDLAASGNGHAVLLTGSYGEAGALDLYGPSHGLPEVYSGHNSYWHWRRPSQDGATVVAVRMRQEFLEDRFDRCDRAATLDNRLGIDNEAQGQPVWVCRGLKGTWEQLWPEFRHYN